MGAARWRARSLRASPVGSVSLTFLDLTCITFIGVRLDPDRPGDHDRRREGHPQHLNGCSKCSVSIRARGAGRERPHWLFPRRRSTRDPLNTIGAITALRPLPPSDVEDRRQTGTICLPAGDVRADAWSRVLDLAYTTIVGQPSMLQQSSRRFTVAGRPVRWLSCLGDGQGGRSSGEIR